MQSNLLINLSNNIYEHVDHTYLRNCGIKEANDKYEDPHSPSNNNRICQKDIKNYSFIQ